MDPIAWTSIALLVAIVAATIIITFAYRHRVKSLLPKESPYETHLTVVEVITDPNTNQSMLTIELAIKKKEGSGYWSPPPTPSEIKGVVSDLAPRMGFDFKTPSPGAETDEQPDRRI